MSKSRGQRQRQRQRKNYREMYPVFIAGPISEDTINSSPVQYLWPSNEMSIFPIPNTTPQGYPMDVPDGDIINTTSYMSDPATVYSGIEPLAALSTHELTRHFKDTSVPRTSTLLGNRTKMNSSVFVSPHSESEERQRLMLRQMESSIQHHNRYRN